MDILQSFFFKIRRFTIDDREASSTERKLTKTHLLSESSRRELNVKNYNIQRKLYLMKDLMIFVCRVNALSNRMKRHGLSNQSITCHYRPLPLIRYKLFEKNHLRT